MLPRALLLLLLAALAAPLVTPRLSGTEREGGRRVGERRLASEGWIEYVHGDAPLVIAAPHGGELRPAGLPERVSGVLLSDGATLELQRELTAAFSAITGARPHLITCRLHRDRLDANRALEEGAQGAPGAQRAWREYHGFIEEARVAVTEEHGAGLFVDLHGHAHPEGRVELGYLLRPAELELDDTSLDRTREPFSLRALARASGLAPARLVRGNASLGALLERAGHATVPSPRHRAPGEAEYFEGGYSTRRHGSADAGSVDAVQIEVPRGLRLDPGARRRFAADLADALAIFLVERYDWSFDARGAAR